jgi:hypothetical protein
MATLKTVSVSAARVPCREHENEATVTCARCCPSRFEFGLCVLVCCESIWGHMRTAPRVMPLGGRASQWVPAVSNPALCRVVGMRKDGRTLRLFRGRRRTYSLPLGSPIWGFTAHVGGRAPSRVHIWSRRSSLFGCFSALRLHVSHPRPGLYCIVLSSRLCCLRVVCINMNERFAFAKDATLFHDVHSGGARHQLTSGHQLTATSGHILTTCIRRDERGGARLA